MNVKIPIDVSRFLQPVPVAALALIVALAAGPGWFWYKSDSIVAHILAARHAQAAAEAEVQGERRAQGWDFWTIEMENLANELKEERARLRQTSDQLDQRAARLAAERQELDRLRTELEGMRSQIDAQVIGIRVDEAKNLRALAQTYTKLSPTAAVAILRNMDDATVVKILSLMKADITGQIFEEMARTPDGVAGETLAKRAAVISDKIRLMKSH